MRLPSSSSLILTSLVVSSSLSALAAPADCGIKDPSFFVPAAELAEPQLTLIQYSSDDAPSNHLQTGNLIHRDIPKARTELLDAVKRRVSDETRELLSGHAGRQVGAGSGEGYGPSQPQPTPAPP